MTGQDGTDVAALTRRLESLESEVTELRRQLAQAQKLESLGRLTSGVAHDFNNFLTIVLSNAAQLRASAEAAGDARGARRAGMIERAGERGARLASQLLSFARKQTLFPETAGVGPLLAAMQDLLSRAAGKANALLVRCPDDVWTIRVDPTQFESALLNLVINAGDAMPAGGGTIAITAQNVGLGLAEASRLRLPPGEFVRIERCRHRQRHCAGAVGPDLRALLHHQAGRAAGSAWRRCAASSANPAAPRHKESNSAAAPRFPAVAPRPCRRRRSGHAERTPPGAVVC